MTQTQGKGELKSEGKQQHRQTYPKQTDNYSEMRTDKTKNENNRIQEPSFLSKLSQHKEMQCNEIKQLMARICGNMMKNANTNFSLNSWSLYEEVAVLGYKTETANQRLIPESSQNEWKEGKDDCKEESTCV